MKTQSHMIWQKCQKCQTPHVNKVKFLFGEGVPSQTFKRQIDKKIIMWSSICTKCGAKDGKVFKQKKEEENV